MPAPAANLLPDPAPHGAAESRLLADMKAWVPLATRTCDQRVMAPLTKSSAGVSQQPNPQLRVGDSGAGKGSAPSDAQLCDFLFLLEGCFRQSRELLGAPSLLQLCFYNSSRIWLEGAWSQVSSLIHLHCPTGPTWLQLP